MGKTRDLFKKIGDIKETFRAKMGTIKERNSKDLTEAEEIKRRWQEYTEELSKKSNDLHNHNGMVTHLEPDILECEVKWVLGSTATKQSWWRWWHSSWAVSNPKRWCCWSAALSMSANMGNSAVATGLEKVSFHSNPQKGQCQRMFKLPYNYAHFTC